MMIEKIMVRASDSIRRTMETISDGNGGIALVVDESKRLLGTISDGDIRRGLLRGLTLEDSVETIVNRNFISANESADRRYILDLMQSHQIRQMPILDKEGRPVALHLMREIIGHRARANVAVIMAGGKGERLRPITESIPKPMALVAGHPILEHILLQLIGAGIRKFYLCVNYKKEVIKDYFGDGKKFGCEIVYVEEEKPLHSGGALSLLPEKPSEPFVLMNGDVITRANIGEMLDAHLASDAMITVGATTYIHKVPFGCLECDDASNVTGLLEKPMLTRLINTGIYVINPEALEWIPYNESYPITNLLTEALNQNKCVQSYMITDWLDIGQLNQLNKANGIE